MAGGVRLVLNAEGHIFAVNQSESESTLRSSADSRDKFLFSYAGGSWKWDNEVAEAATKYQYEVQTNTVVRACLVNNKVVVEEVGSLLKHLEQQQAGVKLKYYTWDSAGNQIAAGNRQVAYVVPKASDSKAECTKEQFGSLWVNLPGLDTRPSLNPDLCLFTWNLQFHAGAGNFLTPVKPVVLLKSSLVLEAGQAVRLTAA